MKFYISPHNGKIKRDSPIDALISINVIYTRKNYRLKPLSGISFACNRRIEICVTPKKASKIEGCDHVVIAIRQQVLLFYELNVQYVKYLK